MAQLHEQDAGPIPNIRNLDPSLFSDEAFLRFGMNQDPVCCASIPGVNVENIKKDACLSDQCEDAMLDTSASKAVTFDQKDFADDGSETVLNIRAYHVPDVPMRLLSPQDLGLVAGNPIIFSTYTPHRARKGYSLIEIKPAQLNWEDIPPLQTKRVESNPRKNLPWIL
eukprot:3695546-Ditylum_brightwellii.AAC.1